MKYLYVAAAGQVDGELMEALRERMAHEFAAPVRPLTVPDVDFAYDADRGQYASIAVLERLARECPADALKLLAVTARDLFIPVLTFVYGQAQLGGRVGVISLARLRQEFYGLPGDRETFVRRAFTEALHETGHLFGLVHCTDRQCAMSLSTNVRQIDGKKDAFCAACATRLAHRPRERES